MPYIAEQEELKILEYWKHKMCFEKSIEQRPKNKPYVFYDGPPFATGLPHYGHIVASLMKDIVPRYWTMRGFRVPRVWGWDCHGLPIENIIEEKLNLKHKKDIEALGIDKFNEACCATVLKYTEEWKKTIERMGRWVDMDHSYRTMDLNYMESVWWVFSELWKKRLIYEGHKAMHICPRCVTALSNFEVTQGYKDVKDISVTVKFKANNAKEILGIDGDVYILAWTTTPWTLPGNVLLAVNPKIRYAVVSFEGKDNERYIIAADRLGMIDQEMNKNDGESDVEIRYGEDLAGITYQPIFPYFRETKNAFRVVLADFVTTEEGTGIVHIAPAFGEDDYEVGLREQVPLVHHVTMEGVFTKDVSDFAGMEVKPKDDRTAADIEIIKWLAKNEKLFSKRAFSHSYPHCWRCDTPLLNYATKSWFVRVTELKDGLLKNNQKISWVPSHMKEGRFGMWLSGARDWAISRSRYWGSVIPVWKSDDGDAICVGSVRELEELSGETVHDLHKHIVDKIIIRKNGKEYRRVPEVLDCWFESGSMPYGQTHYPFENKQQFEQGFPAEFIAEGQDQTRGWFYTLHVLGAALFDKPAFNNVIVNGIVLAEDGRKMSKRLKNYPDPALIMEKYGADAMRYYLATSPVVHAESLNFSEAGVREKYNKVVNTIANVLEFYKMFANRTTDYPALGRDPAKGGGRPQTTDNVLDKWIVVKLQGLIADVTVKMNQYLLAEAARPIEEFITELSQWYVRRSRERFKRTTDHGLRTTDFEQAVETLRYVLLTLSKIMAPFTPFVAEKIYLEVGGEKESVHLEDWPAYAKSSADEGKILEEMIVARKIVEMGLAIRADAGIKVRQTLGVVSVSGVKLSDELKQIIAEELNVKTVSSNVASGDSWKVKEDNGMRVALNVEITDELKKDGIVREITRTINNMRKEAKLTVNDSVLITYDTSDALLLEIFVSNLEELKKSVVADEIKKVQGGEAAEVDGRKFTISIAKA